MKANTIIRRFGRFAACVAMLAAAACTGNFEDYNTKPFRPSDDDLNGDNVGVGILFPSMMEFVTHFQVNASQMHDVLVADELGGYTSAVKSYQGQNIATYNPSVKFNDYIFEQTFANFYGNYFKVETQTGGEGPVYQLARILRVAAMLRVTDAYGPIPYSKLESNESVYVEYDSQEAVYTKMFEELDEAIEILGRNTTLPAEAWSRYDGVYYGNIAQWLKYANSLKLRMAMRLSYVKSDVARAKAAEAIAGGVIEANADNAAMHAAENRTTLIYNDWGDHRVGADILCYMTGYEDPRLEKMFLPNDKGDYVGIRIGIDVTSKSQAQAKYSNMIVTSSTPYLWINAAEVAFLKAEYELRWGTKDAAKALYEQAIRLSFEDKGAKDADAYIADKTRKPAAYNDPLGNYSATALSSITIAWEDDSAEGADKAAIKERNLERIITQKWIAIFPLGVEAWSEHRRTGYPRLLPAVEDKSGGTVDLAQGARRLPYPVEEYDKNNANLQEAVQMLNSESQGSRKGDGMGTRVWWDVKPYNN